MNNQDWRKIALKMQGLIEGYMTRGNQDRLSRAVYIAEQARRGEEIDGKAWPEEATSRCERDENVFLGGCEEVPTNKCGD